MRIRLDQSEAACDLSVDERLLPRRVQHDDAGLHRQRGELTDVVAGPQRLDRHIGIAVDRGIDRHEIVVAAQLQPVAGQIHHRDRVRPRGFGLVDEVAKTLAQRVAIEIAGADHVEAGRLQGLRDQAGIVGRGRQRRFRIGGIADHQRNALFRRCAAAALKCPASPDIATRHAERIDKLLANRMGFHPVAAPRLHRARVKMNIS